MAGARPHEVMPPRRTRTQERTPTSPPSLFDWDRLLVWFDTAKRDLPWRGTHDPYAILVSELMLQQTQVQTVLPYYKRFMERFPTLQSLAGAGEEEVLRFWSGLGYYRRGRNLYRAAREIVRDHQGTIPMDKTELLSLPGIGEYTAGAILSIAFEQAVALVDGNVERVIARLFAMDEDLATTRGKKSMWKLAQDLVPRARPGCHNQALMELGATVCLPTHPKCEVCPLSTSCKAHQLGRTTELPVKSRRPRSEKVSEAVLLIECEGRWLLTNRNSEGLYGGMWQFPWAWKSIQKLAPELDSWAAWHSAFEHLAGVLGQPLDGAREAGTTRHAVTFRTIQTTFFLIRKAVRCGLPEDSFRWVETGSLGEEALPSYQKKVLRLLPTLPAGGLP